MTNRSLNRGHLARMLERGHPARPLTRCGRHTEAGFTLVEVLFAIAILGVGIVGILTLFVSGINMAGWAGSRSQASMEAQSLYAKILSYSAVDTSVTPNESKRVYIEIMRNQFYPMTAGVPKWAGGGTPGTAISIWLHQNELTDFVGAKTGPSYADPVPISPGHDYWWKCRVANYMLDKRDPLSTDPNIDTAALKANINPPGLVEVAIAIYKQWKKGKEPLAVYTTLLSLESK